MAFARPERVGETGELRAWRTGSWSRRMGRPVRIDSLDVPPGTDPETGPAGGSTPERIVLLRFEWRSSGDEIQPVILALPELLD